MQQTEIVLTKACVFAADLGEYNIERSINEIYALAETAGFEITGEIIQKRDKLESATFLGEGRLFEGKLVCENTGAEYAIFDAELTGIQIRNLEDILKVPVLDRTMLILDIFASRATTNEGKLQVELAKLKYRLPRLLGLGNSLSRQGGGGSGGGGARRGSGETKLEYDRRYIKERIAFIQDKITQLDKRRSETRKQRQKNNVPVIALVGYTNVGKSSLLNKLCGSEVLAKDMLFATLDPTARKFTMPSGQNVIFVDTVGFVSRLPHNLVKAFKSTLDEAKYADVILKVCDISDSDAQSQLDVTDNVLQELDCNQTDTITVYNKCDITNQATLFDKNAIMVSAHSGLGLDTLLSRIDSILSNRMVNFTAIIPYDNLQLISPIHQNGNLISEEYTEQGALIKASIKKQFFHIYKDFLCE